ncbi:dethiobiotin synthetase, partial [Micromonospora sp. AMSO31t]
MQVAVCGPAEATPEERAQARRVGELLAERGVTVLCG